MRRATGSKFFSIDRPVFKLDASTKKGRKGRGEPVGSSLHTKIYSKSLNEFDDNFLISKGSPENESGK